MAKLFGYGRASTDRQQITMASQQEICENYYRLKLAQDPTLQWAGWFPDAAVTAKMPLFERPMGEQLFLQAREGDIIVASNFDRLFRSVSDCDNTLEHCRERKVGLVILDVDVNTTSNLGAAFMRIIAALKRLELDEVSRRTREALAINRRNMHPHSDNVPIGYVKRGIGRRARFVPDPVERKWCKLIVSIFNRGYTIRSISDYFNHKVKTIGLTTGPSRNLLKHRYLITRCFVAAICGFPCVYMTDLPTVTDLFKYMALHDARPPQIGALQVQQGLLYTLPPVEGPLPCKVAYTFPEYQGPCDASSVRLRGRRSLQDLPPLSSWLDKQLSLHPPSTPTP